MKKTITYVAAAFVLFSCTKTELKEVEVEKLVEVDKIVEVPTAVELEQVSLAAGTTMTTESDEQTIVVSAALESVLAEDVLIELNFSGSAEFNSDYTVSSEAISIAAGQQTGFIELTVVSDDIFESGIENIVISLAGLPDTVTPSDTSGTVQIDIADGDAIVAFSTAAITIEETSFYSLDIMLSKALNDDIVVYYEAETSNTRYGVSDSFVIIPAGQTSRSIAVDVNDSRLTTSEDLAIDVTITSVENEDAMIGSNGTIAISATEVDAGLQIDASWTTQSDLFELRLYDALDAQVSSSTNGGNSESLFINKNAFTPLANGTYTIELDDFNFSGASPSEVVTLELLDETGATYGGPYTFTVNNPGDRIVVLNLEVLDGVYTITQTSTSN